MYNLFENLLEVAKKNHDTLSMLKNTAIKAQQFELASKLRDLEKEFYPMPVKAAPTTGGLGLFEKVMLTEEQNKIAGGKMETYKALMNTVEEISKRAAALKEGIWNDINEWYPETVNFNLHLKTDEGSVTPYSTKEK